MTGFRIGYAIASPEIIRAMTRLQSHSTGNVNTFSQYGALAAFDIESRLKENRLNIFRKRRDLAYSLCTEIFECIKPEGAFYLFPCIKSTGMNSEELSEMLLQKAGVAVVPGVVFGAEGHIRIIYAASEEDIKEGFRRIREALR